ncbi:putative phage integrase [Burkholderia lata]|nr:putative phage integrase [Burkholderia lata]
MREAWAAYLDAHRSKWSEHHMLDHERLAETGGQEKARQGLDRCGAARGTHGAKTVRL